MIDKIPRGIFNTPEEEAANPAHAKALRAHKARLFDVAGEIEEDDDGLNYWIKPEVLPPLPSEADPSWQGIRKDVGIFTDQEFEFIMSKCLRSLSRSAFCPAKIITYVRRACWRSCGIIQCHVSHPLRCPGQQEDDRSEETHRSSPKSCRSDRQQYVQRCSICAYRIGCTHTWQPDSETRIQGSKRNKNHRQSARRWQQRRHRQKVLGRK